LSSTEPKNVRILLAEDTPEHRELLVMALSGDRPYVHVTAVASGKEAREVLEKDRFDCMVFDYNLQDIQAPKLIVSTRSSVGGCPVFVVSTDTEQWTAIEAFRGGATDFIPKAIAMTTDELWESIQRAFASRDVGSLRRSAG